MFFRGLNGALARNAGKSGDVGKSLAKADVVHRPASRECDWLGGLTRDVVARVAGIHAPIIFTPVLHMGGNLMLFHMR